MKTALPWIGRVVVRPVYSFKLETNLQLAFSKTGELGLAETLWGM